jgi:hypothetical protein
MERLKGQHGEEFDRILNSNLIPPLDDSGLLLDDFEYFLAVRLDHVINRVRELTEGIEGVAVATESAKTGQPTFGLA